MTSKWGYVAAIGGTVAAGVGIALVVRSRRASGSMRGLEIQRYQGKNGAQTTMYYNKKKLPIEQRIKMLQGLVLKGVTEHAAELRPLALSITKHCPARDDMCELKAIHDWTKANVRYTGDVGPIMLANGRVEPIDFFASAKRAIENGGEDCDGHAVVNATLGALNGFEMLGRITAPTKWGDDAWSHIYAVGKTRYGTPREVILDTTLTDMDSFNVEMPYARKKDFPA